MTQSLRVDFAKNRVNGTIQIFEFNDHQFFVIYAPSLNLSAYGNTVDEAKEMFNEVVSDLFENLISKPEYVVTTELRKLGWERNRIFQKKFTSRAYVDKEGVIRNFNLADDTAIEEALVTCNMLQWETTDPFQRNVRKNFLQKITAHIRVLPGPIINGDVLGA